MSHSIIELLHYFRNLHTAQIQGHSCLVSIGQLLLLCHIASDDLVANRLEGCLCGTHQRHWTIKFHLWHFGHTEHILWTFLFLWHVWSFGDGDLFDICAVSSSD